MGADIDSVLVRGPKLALRHARRDDAAALFELARDPDVTHFFSWGPYEDLSQPLAYIDSLDVQREAGTRLELIIADAADRPIGVTGLSEFSQRDRRAVVGTWLGKSYWGTGANAESKALLLALAFRRLGLQRATAFANPVNRRSLAALERLGFENEGVLRDWHIHNGVAQDCAVLRLTAAEFDRSALAGVPVTFEADPPSQFVLTPVSYSQRK